MQLSESSTVAPRPATIEINNGMRYQTEAEFLELLEIYKNISNKRFVLEIGSMFGETLHEWMNCGEPGMHVISIDMMVPPMDIRREEQERGHNVLWAQWANEKNMALTLIDADSKNPEVILKVRSLVPYLDFLFIDGGHDYATVMSDFKNFHTLVRPGGIIAFHDIGHLFEVIRCWNEVKSGRDFKEIVVKNGMGIGVLYV